MKGDMYRLILNLNHYSTFKAFKALMEPNWLGQFGIIDIDRPACLSHPA